MSNTGEGGEDPGAIYQRAATLATDRSNRVLPGLWGASHYLVSAKNGKSNWQGAKRGKADKLPGTKV